jgi:hypothetical protein
MVDDDENLGVPCCTLKATRGMTKIQVGSNLIGIIEFPRIMDDVEAMGLEDEDQLRSHLLKEMKRYNYVPVKFEDEYADALLLEFRKRDKARS